MVVFIDRYLKCLHLRVHCLRSSSQQGRQEMNTASWSLLICMLQRLPSSKLLSISNAADYLSSECTETHVTWKSSCAQCNPSGVNTASLGNISVQLPPALHGPCTLSKRTNEIPCFELYAGLPCNLVICALNFSDMVAKI